MNQLSHISEQLHESKVGALSSNQIACDFCGGNHVNGLCEEALQHFQEPVGYMRTYREQPFFYQDSQQFSCEYQFREQQQHWQQDRTSSFENTFTQFIEETQKKFQVH